MNPNVNGAAAFLPNGSSFSASALSESAVARGVEAAVEQPVENALSAPALSSPPAELSDAELLAATRSLVGRSNRLLASLLAHLAEVEARGVHRTRACSSLYTYCIYELRFSEDEAFRRVSAARLVRRFPVLLEAIAAGELHLTGLLMLGPHLTTENLIEVLARAKHRTKKEIGRLVRMLDPLPDVPSRIDPLGPEPAQLVSSAPTWSRFVGSMNATRELAPGDRPLDWTEDTVEDPASDRCQARGELALADGSAPARGELVLPDGAAPARGALVLPDGGHALARSELALPDRAAPARLTPQRYGVQFTASKEYVDLVEKAQALLSHSAPRAGLDEIHLRAMRVLVAELERQRYAVTARPQQRARATSTPAAPTPEAHQASERVNQGRSAAAEPEPEPTRAGKSEPSHPERAEPRWRGRYVPAAVRRAVFARDQGRCTYAGDLGQRCRETSGLELHHARAFARGGEHTEENLTLRCRAHNDVAAEKDFGRAYVELARDSTEHEPCATHEAAPVDARAGLR
jgi:hypothetical protein